MQLGTDEVQEGTLRGGGRNKMVQEGTRWGSGRNKVRCRKIRERKLIGNPLGKINNRRMAQRNKCRNNIWYI